MPSLLSRIVGSSSFWSGYFKFYDALAKMHSNTRLRREVALSLQLKPGGRYLDFACGTANVACTMLQLQPGIEIVGMDNNAAGLRIAQKKVPSASYVQSNMDAHLPFSSEVFNGVAVVNGLYLSKNPQLTLEEIKRIMRPTGLLVVSNPRAGSNPRNIVKEEISLASASFSKEYGTCRAWFELQKYKLELYAGFFKFAPFQLVLMGGSPHFEPTSYWQDLAINKVGFELVGLRTDLYGGDNDTFVLRKP
ncbi:MAG: methyltransferase domain-containing protein [Candidatus Margulisiibacteriota bacterium]